jgi:hypothetical protein
MLYFCIMLQNYYLSNIWFCHKEQLGGSGTKYRVIWNDCRGFNNLSYTMHLR